MKSNKHKSVNDLLKEEHDRIFKYNKDMSEAELKQKPFMMVNGQLTNVCLN